MTSINIYRLFIYLFLLALLTGCSLPIRPTELISGTSSAVAPTAEEEMSPSPEPLAEEGVPPPSAPPAEEEVPPSSEPEPIIIPVEGTPAPTIPPNAPRDPCLEGTWIMPTSSLDLLMASIIPESTPVLSIPSGQLKLTFTDVAFTYSGDFIMRVNNPDGSWAEGHALFENSGGYTTDMHMLTFDTQVSQSQMFDCKGGSGGQVFSTMHISRGDHSPRLHRTLRLLGASPGT